MKITEELIEEMDKEKSEIKGTKDSNIMQK